jgi:hypothetical protein
MICGKRSAAASMGAPAPFASSSPCVHSPAASSARCRPRAQVRRPAAGGRRVPTPHHFQRPQDGECPSLPAPGGQHGARQRHAGVGGDHSLTFPRWSQGDSNPGPPACKVAATAGPGAAQVKGSAGCSVNDRESPSVTLLTGTRRARLGQVCSTKSGSKISGKPGSGTRKAWQINSRNLLLVFCNQRSVVHRPG